MPRFYKSQYLANPTIYVEGQGQWRSFAPAGVTSVHDGLIPESILNGVQEISRSEAEELLARLYAETEREATRRLAPTRRARVLRVVRIVRWPLALAVVIIAVFVYMEALSGACAPGLPGLQAADLSSATITVLYPAGGGPPKKISVDISDPEAKAELLGAYQSMRKWEGEVSAITPSPDLSLELVLKDGHRLVVIMQRTNYPEAIVRTYKGQTLESTAWVDPKAMRDYLLTKGR